MISGFRLAASRISLVTWLALSSSAAMAQCQSWQLPEKFNAIEDNGFFVVFDLKKVSDGKYTGTVHYNDFKTNREVKGRASADMNGAKLDIRAEWVTTPSGGGHYTYYNGSISDGSIAGLKKDPTRPRGDKNREVFWKSKQTATCLIASKHDIEVLKDRIEAKKKKDAQEASTSSEPPPVSRPSGQRIELNVDRAGRDYRRFEVPIERYQSCLEACEADGKCKAYTYVRAGVQGAKGVCWLKDAVPAKNASRCCVSGVLR